MEDEGSAGATVENTQEPMAGEAGIPDLSEGAWAKNFNGWAMEVSPAGIGFIRICNGRPNEVYRLNSGATRGFIRGVPCNDGLAGCPLRSPAELKGIV